MTLSQQQDVTGSWHDAVIAAALLAAGGNSFGGVVVKAASGPVRDRWLALVREFSDCTVAMRKVPIGVSAGRMLGGLDLAATIQAGRPVLERGLLAEADGGLLIVPSAERLERSTAAMICSALDDGQVTLQRDGFSKIFPVRAGVIALDESRGDGEAVCAALNDRLAVHIALDGIRYQDAAETYGLAEKISSARQMLPRIDIGEEGIEALCAAAVVLGAGSVRTACQAAAVARLAAALAGRIAVEPEDLQTAVRLVLAPRATRLPMTAEDQEDAQSEPEEDPPSSPDQDPSNDQTLNDETLKDLVLAAAHAAIPEGLLALLKSGQAQRRQSTQGKSGAQKKSAQRGRAIGTVRGDPKTGARIDILETLRVAAPWQKIRKRQSARPMRLEIRRDDIRVKRFNSKSETTTLFVVDASGSSALHRLAEAKGAVELMLADCYVRRDSVALIAFRGKTADVLLAPTRSLARAKRNLAALPGGGGTPLALALDAAGDLGQGLRRKGQTPSVVFLTDGRANVSRDGQGGRTRAMEDALQAAKAFKIINLAALVIDTSPQPKDEARKLAAEMGATYLPLPHANAEAVSEAVRLNMPAVR